MEVKHRKFMRFRYGFTRPHLAICGTFCGDLRRRGASMEGRTEGGLRGGALSTLEAMVVSMGFMAPSVAMFFNTPFIAQFAGAAIPLAMVLSFAAVLLVALGFSQLAHRTVSGGRVYACVSNVINLKTRFMGIWLY